MKGTAASDAISALRVIMIASCPYGTMSKRIIIA
jgi:hypothetical protein